MNNLYSAMEADKNEENTAKLTTQEPVTTKNTNETASLMANSPTKQQQRKHSNTCQHLKLLKNKNYDTCFHCGVQLPKNGTKNYKSPRLNYVAHFSPQTILETMLAKPLAINKDKNPEYTQLRQTYVDWIIELAEKLKISSLTTHLAVYLLDILMYRDSAHNPQLQLFAPVALLVAAKTIELDERIPFISKIRRLANPIFSVDEFRKAELVLLETLDWNPQISTNLEIMEFFLTQGIVNSQDDIETDSECIPILSSVLKEKNNHSAENKEPVKAELDVLKSNSSNQGYFKENDENVYKPTSPLSTASTSSETSNCLQNSVLNDENENQSTLKQSNSLKKRGTEDYSSIDRKNRTTKIPETKLDELVDKLERDIPKLAGYILKDSDFLGFEQKILAASSIAFVRKVNKFSQPWNSELELISGLSFESLTTCFDLIMKKFEGIFLLTVLNMCKTPKTNVSVTPTPKNDSACAELKLFNKTYSANKPSFEYGNGANSYDPSSKLNLYSNNIYSKPSDTTSLAYELSIRERERNERNKIFNFQPKSTTSNGATTNNVGLANNNAYANYREELFQKPSYNGSGFAPELAKDKERERERERDRDYNKYSNYTSSLAPIMKYSSTTVSSEYSGVTAPLYNSQPPSLHLPDSYIKNNDILSGKSSGLLSARHLQSKIGVYNKK